MIKVRGFEAPAAKPPPRIAPVHAARPFFSAPKIGSPGAGPECPQRSAMRRPADLRRGIPCQPTQLGAPGPLLLQAAAPRASDSEMSRILALSSNPYCSIAPNKNLRARGQAGRCQPCGIPIEASCAARARGGEAYQQLGALILAPLEIAVSGWLRHCAARPALPTHCHTCTSRQGFRAARRAGRAGEAYRHSDDGVDRLNHRHGR